MACILASGRGANHHPRRVFPKVAPRSPRWGDLLKFSQLKSIKCLILETSPPPMPYNGQNHLGGSRTRDNRVGLCGVKGAQAGVNPALPGALRSLRHRRLLVECQRVLLCVVLLRHRARDCHLCQRRGVSRSVRRVGGQACVHRQAPADNGGRRVSADGGCGAGVRSCAASSLGDHRGPRLLVGSFCLGGNAHRLRRDGSATAGVALASVAAGMAFGEVAVVVHPTLQYNIGTARCSSATRS